MFLGTEHVQINKTDNSKSRRTPKASIFPKKYHRGDRGTLRSRQGADGVPQQNLGRGTARGADPANAKQGRRREITLNPDGYSIF